MLIKHSAGACAFLALLLVALVSLGGQAPTPPSRNASPVAEGGTASLAVRVSHLSSFEGKCNPLSVTVHFRSNVTGGSAPYSYSWRFGDGGTSSEPDPSHTYAPLRNVTISLEVTDSLGETANGSESFTPPPPFCSPLVNPFSATLAIAMAVTASAIVALLVLDRRWRVGRKPR